MSTRRANGVAYAMSLALGVLGACSPTPPTLVVIGGGPAGLAAAVEAAGAGARVTVFEGDEFVGGSARWAGGVTFVPTPDERQAWDALAGSPSASRDRYATTVQTAFIDWSGVSFNSVPDPSGDGATLFAPSGGGMAIVAALVTRAEAAGVAVHTGCRVTDLSRAEATWEVKGACGPMTADRVLIATGGFMGNLDEARRRLGVPPDVTLLRSAPSSSDGSGLGLAEGVGVPVADQLRGIVYSHSVPLPRSPLEAGMIMRPPPGSLVVDTRGRPHPELLHVRGESGARLLDLPKGMAWLVGAEAAWGRASAHWLGGRPIPLGAVADAHGARGADIDALSAAVGLPADMMRTYVGVMGEGPSADRPLPSTGPYLAVPLHASPAKSLGGLPVDGEGRVLDEAGVPIPGLYAAGEVTGFGLPYGAAPRDSTMVAGAVLTGRAAGKAAAANAKQGQ